VKGFYFHYKFPFNEALANEVLSKLLNTPLCENSLNSEVRVKTNSEIENDNRDKENE